MDLLIKPEHLLELLRMGKLYIIHLIRMEMYILLAKLIVVGDNGLITTMCICQQLSILICLDVLGLVIHCHLLRNAVQIQRCVMDNLIFIIHGVEFD
jgi:hypothetical protein